MPGQAGVTRSAVALLDPTYRGDALTPVRSDWPAIRMLFKALKDDRDRGAFDPARWRDFLAACADTEARPPYHLRAVVEAVQQAADGKARSAVKGIDHGCGTGLNILYLHALGFTGLRGVNIVANCLAWNSWLRRHAGYGGDVFALYDGRKLPAEDGSQDVVFSQQVLEHVEPALLESYYREEGRVLREGGLAVHQVPHRLSPYDSHTRTWFVHWLPRRLQMPIYRLLGRDAGWVASDLFLRSPGRHVGLVRRWIGTPRDETRARIARLGREDVGSYYDGPTRLRLLLSKASALPFAGNFLGRLIAPWLMAETVAVKNAEAASAKRSRRRLVLPLSDNVIDFDSYLPIAMALKRARPEFDIRFVTFSRENYDFILANPTLVAGLKQSGSLFLFDRAGNAITRRLRTLCAFARLAAWLAARPGSVLFNGRQFSELPYAVLYVLNRVLGGKGYLLLRVRQPDDGIKVNILPRFTVPEGPASFIERWFGRDHDGMIVYHRNQERYIQTLNQFGRVGTVPRLTTGLPNLWPEWQTLIDREIERERRALAADGLDVDEIYTLLAPKSFSSRYLRTADSGEQVFRKVLLALRQIRPNATLLIRPHPRAFREPWFEQAVADLGDGRVRISLTHPDVLVALSRRVIAPNTSTIMFVVDRGRFIDCTDYADEHFAVHGRVSQCHGYDTVYLDPNSADLKRSLAPLLDDAQWPRGPEMTARRHALIDGNPYGRDALLEWIESGPSVEPYASAA